MKRWIALFLAIVLAFSFAACSSNGGNSEEVKTIDIQEFTTSAIQEYTFRDEMLEIDEEVIAKQYKLGDHQDKITAMSVWVSASGAMVDEIALFEFDTAENAKKAEEIAISRKDSLEKKFKDYIPDEVQQLDTARYTVKGNYLLFVISPDSAKIEDAFNQAVAK